MYSISRASIPLPTHSVKRRATWHHFQNSKAKVTNHGFFNSSIAEQTNVWLGGYHSICREMLVDKYNFFLDEMILRRNRMTREKLMKEGAMPSTWPST